MVSIGGFQDFVVFFQCLGFGVGCIRSRLEAFGSMV